VNANRILKGSIATLFGAVFLYAALLFFSDARKAVRLVAGFDVWIFLAMLGLSLVCYLTRLVRFHYLMNLLERPLSLRDAFYIQFSGMTMTLTPGKVGEILKAFLARERAGLPVSAGVSLVFVERVTDFLAVLILSLGGIGAISGNYVGIAIIFGLTAAAIVFLSVPTTQRFTVSVVERLPGVSRFAGSLETMFASMGQTLKPGPLTVSVGLAVLGWGSEGLAFALALRSLGHLQLGVFQAVAVYAVSTIVGALAMLPGGLGLTEGSMMGILVAARVPRADAFVVTLIIRFTTLWFGVILGALVLFTRPALLRKVFSEIHIESQKSRSRGYPNSEF
jgi:uncharacterized protein (TIRG00374 family)